MMDEPGSGVDLEALELVGDLINRSFPGIRLTR
jgi:Fe-S cluster assembly ATPase SufC